MRIFDGEHDFVSKGILLMLTRSEAVDLMGYLGGLLESDDPGDHRHVNDEDYQHEITIALYDDNSVKQNCFDGRINKLIEFDE